MPNGTTLNGVFAPRVHKHNARDKLEGAESALQWARERLFMISALTPASDVEGLGELHSEVADVIDGIQRATWERFCAQYIIDYPDEVCDELEEK